MPEPICRQHLLWFHLKPHPVGIIAVFVCPQEPAAYQPRVYGRGGEAHGPAALYELGQPQAIPTAVQAG